MSCFNWVAFEMDCPRCLKPVRGFQTKEHRDMQVCLPHTVSNFYSDCEGCGTWIEFQDGIMLSPRYDTGSEMLGVPTDGEDHTELF